MRRSNFPYVVEIAVSEGGAGKLPRKKLGHDANGKPKPTGALPQNTAMPIHIYCINQLAKRA